ncbi:ABC transporter ATP-binding protein [Draconibacterium halophilum]|uniref:Multidrug resistance-like ATP-binding protein MdlB n=1 Tax=Draconibacterium halophilum TaxID=2706887 RepID=A0A6C0RIG0_9BACT|nr:ABC transporter ATP-binding protein [Draconibacterium halophilum]QIA09333.1 ABC transporter ATP-binding protein [Draconibacterium halophilum]
MSRGTNNIIKNVDWQLFRKFAGYFKPHKKWFFLSIASIPITTGAGILFLWLIEDIVDNYIVPGNVDGLVRQIIFLALALLINILFDGFYSYSFSKAGGLAVVDLRRRLFGKSLRFPLSYFDKKPIGVTLSRLTSDMESVSDSFAAGVLGLLADSIKTLALVGYLFYINWRLTLVLLLVVPLIILVINFLRKKIRKAYNTSRTSLAKSAAYLQEALTGMKTVQLFAAEDKVLNKYDDLNKQFCDAQNKSNVYDSFLYSIVEGITSVATALVIWYGAIQIWDYGYTLGILIVFVTTLERLFIPVKQFAQQISTIQRAMSALEHISELFDQKVEDPAAESSETVSEAIALQEIEFKNVFFRYSEDTPDVLKDVSFKLQKGDRMALVGTTGSGKSTIIRLLAKTYTGYRGSIKINGTELADIPIAEIRETISIMQQDIYMFNDSVEFNISLGRESISQSDVQQSASFVYANYFIDQLPNKYKFVVQDNGDNLSKGQAQLISFARAIAGNSELIILDEATSAVDSITEQYIQKAIANIFSKKTVIAVAHRLSTIKNSDMILVLEDGQIIERGNHKQLLEYGGKYARLLHQFEEEEKQT